MTDRENDSPLFKPADQAVGIQSAFTMAAVYLDDAAEAVRAIDAWDPRVSFRSMFVD